MKPDNNSKSGGLWLLFFAFFLGAPALAIVLPSMERDFHFPGGAAIVVLLAGAVCSGLTLAKLFSRRSDESIGTRIDSLIGMGIVFTFGVLFVYFGIAFIGCALTFRM